MSSPDEFDAYEDLPNCGEEEDPYDEYPDDNEDDDARDECSWDGIAGHSCMAIGSEQCDFECPYRNEMFHGFRQARDENGRFTSINE